MRPRRLFHLHRVDADVDAELRFHIEMRTEELRARGMSGKAARAEALRQFGDVEDARRYCREMDTRHGRERRRSEWWADTVRDGRLALRGLRRQPAFAATVVLTLALGIGANVTMLGIVDRLLLRPPAHVRDPDLLRRLYFTRFDDGQVRTQAQMGYLQYLEVRDGLAWSGGVAGYYNREMMIGEGEAARQGQVTLATASFFPALGVRPVLGRFFTEEEDRPPLGTGVAVISDEMWRRDFGGEPSAVGKTVTIAGHRLQIVGIAPRGFTGIDLDRVEAWVPLSTMADEVIGTRYIQAPWHEARNIAWMRGVARLRLPSDIARGESDATAAFRRALELRWNAARADSVRPRAALEPLLLELRRRA